MTWMETLRAAFPPALGWVAVVCAALCAVGFRRFVYFISVGYGLAIAGAGVTLLVLFRGSLTPGTAVVCLLFAVYGARLAGFLLAREWKSASYRRTMGEVATDGNSVPLSAQFVIWVSVTLLYVAQTAPATYRLANGAADGPWLWVGAVVLAAGLVLETVADWQKAAAKRVNPGRFCASGLYRWVRCPNYFGELLIWTGAVLTGIGGLQGWGQWVVALLGYVVIVYVMFSGARRLELRQNAQYGGDPAYQTYVARTPILLPMVPLYSLKDWNLVKI